MSIDNFACSGVLDMFTKLRRLCDDEWIRCVVCIVGRFIVRRAPVEVAVSNFGIEIGTITMDISFHEMNFHQQ